MSNNEYYKRKINVRKHKRYDPRADKKVDVNSYNRNQQFKKYKRTKQKSVIDYTKKPVKTKKQIKPDKEDGYLKYYKKTIAKIENPIKKKMTQIEKKLEKIEEENGRSYSKEDRFDILLRYPKENEKGLVEEYKKLSKKITKLNSRDYDLKLQKRWNRIQELPLLKEDQKYYVISLDKGYAKHLSYTKDKERAVIDFQINKAFLEKIRPELEVKIISAKNIEDVRNQLYAKGRKNYLITGDTYPNRKKIRNIARVKFDYNEKGYRGKLSPEEVEKIKKIPGLEIEKITPMTKEDVDISKRAKAQSKSQKYLRHKRKEESIWQKKNPFTKEQQWTWNSLTHYPQDWNKEFKNSVNKKEKEILKKLKIQKIEDAPEDVQNAYDYYCKNTYNFIREYNRARQVAPPVSVVGPAKYPKQKIPKADAIRKRASERLEKANKTVDKITYQYVKLQPRKSREEIRQEYRENITPKLIEAKKKEKKVYSTLHNKWYPIKRVNKKSVTVKAETGDYNFTIDKHFITQIEGINLK